MSAGVEWALHCTVLLAVLQPTGTLPGRALAEFHGVSESYLLKHMQALTKAGICESVPGPTGRLSARPQAPRDHPPRHRRSDRGDRAGLSLRRDPPARANRARPFYVYRAVRHPQHHAGGRARLEAVASGADRRRPDPAVDRAPWTGSGSSWRRPGSRRTSGETGSEAKRGEPKGRACRDGRRRYRSLKTNPP